MNKQKLERTYDGSNNNRKHAKWGKAGEPLRRGCEGSAYEQGNRPARSSGPNSRHISNCVCRQDSPGSSAHGLTDFVWAWGQFLDHELDLTQDVGEKIGCQTPSNDPVMPGVCVEIKRSKARWGSTWEQINELSSYIDGANVYGPSKERADALRSFQGGELQQGKNKLLPKNIRHLDNLQSRSERLFLAGDIRANEHVVLTCMHTLFVREHNRYCRIAATALRDSHVLCEDPAARDEQIFQRARRYIGAVMQVITFGEFLPTLLGKRMSCIGSWKRYDPNVDASISNLFSTACYRLGHSMLSESIILKDCSRMLLRDAFFKPELVDEYGIEQFLGGLHKQVMRRIDTRIVESVRSFLFRTPGGSDNMLGDLAAFNVLRGRDHGLPDYNTCRQAFGLNPKATFDQITSDGDLARDLACLYGGNIDTVDPWIGGLAEDHEEGGNMGEFIRAVLVDQFTRLRDGDRFWYRNDAALKTELCQLGDQRKELLGGDCQNDPIEQLEGVTLAHILCKNTKLKRIPDDVFRTCAEEHPKHAPSRTCSPAASSDQGDEGRNRVSKKQA